MKSKLVRVARSLLLAVTASAGFSVAIAALPEMPQAIASGTTTQQVAQAGVALTERNDYRNTCRNSGAIPLKLYGDARLTQILDTLPVNTILTLTGVVGNGIAQIKAPKMGWVQSATLTTACSMISESNSLPTDLDTNPKYCRRLRDSKTDGSDYQLLDIGLVAFDRPGVSLQRFGNEADGPGRAAIVRVTRLPPEIQVHDGRNWIRVKYMGQGNVPRIGWIANGPAGVNRNLATCL